VSAEDALADEARRHFVRKARVDGTDMPTARVLRIQAPLDDSGDTDCWTYAHRYAAAAPPGTVLYMEGMCYLPPGPDGRPRVAAHAWAVENTPVGHVVVEFTPGYEEAWGYRGFRVPLDHPAVTRAEHGGRRYSAMELMIAEALVEAHRG
jgi:hypothetical protein